MDGLIYVYVKNIHPKIPVENSSKYVNMNIAIMKIYLMYILHYVQQLGYCYYSSENWN